MCLGFLCVVSFFLALLLSRLVVVTNGSEMSFRWILFVSFEADDCVTKMFNFCFQTNCCFTVYARYGSLNDTCKTKHATHTTSAPTLQHSNTRTTHTHLHNTQHNTTQHNTQHNTTQHNTTQHNTTQHNTTQHNTTSTTTTQHQQHNINNTQQHNNTHHTTTQPHNHTTTQPHNHTTTQPHNHTTHNTQHTTHNNTQQHKTQHTHTHTTQHNTQHNTTHNTTHIESSGLFRCSFPVLTSFCHPWELDAASLFRPLTSGLHVLDQSVRQSALSILGYSTQSDCSQSKNLTGQRRSGSSSSALILSRYCCLLSVVASLSSSFWFSFSIWNSEDSRESWNDWC